LLTRIYVGGLLIEKGRILLKMVGEGSKRRYIMPGKYLEGDETLEMAVSKGFERDVGCRCAVRDLVYIIESFKEEEERELGVFFLVSAPSSRRLEGVGAGLLFVGVDDMIRMEIRPQVLGGKIFADEKRGSRGSATYLVDQWNE